MIKHFNIKIYGRVQGVFFRESAKNKAEELEINGFAKNEPDGILYIEAEGKEEKLKEFLDWCGYGPELADVEKVDFDEEEKLKSFKKFEVRF